MHSLVVASVEEANGGAARLEDKDATPSFRVFDIPYLCRPHTYPGLPPRPGARILLPVLAVRTAEGKVLIPDEPLSWSENLARSGRPTLEIRRQLNTVGRFFELVETIAPDRVLQPGLMDLLVWEYLRVRLETPVDPGARRFGHWQPVQYEVVRTEFRDLVDFGRYCVSMTVESGPCIFAQKGPRLLVVRGTPVSARSGGAGRGCTA